MEEMEEISENALIIWDSEESLLAPKQEILSDGRLQILEILSLFRNEAKRLQLIRDALGMIREWDYAKWGESLLQINFWCSQIKRFLRRDEIDGISEVLCKAATGKLQPKNIHTACVFHVEHLSWQNINDMKVTRSSVNLSWGSMPQIRQRYGWD